MVVREHELEMARKKVVFVVLFHVLSAIFLHGTEENNEYLNPDLRAMQTMISNTGCEGMNRSKWLRTGPIPYLGHATTMLELSMRYELHRNDLLSVTCNRWLLSGATTCGPEWHTDL
jgi:hypothetical protein